RLLVGLSLPHVGEETARAVARQMGSLERLMQASSDELAAIDGVGNVVADAIAAWFADAENRMFLARLSAHVTATPLPNEAAQGPLSGVSVVITGSFDGLSREE